MYQVGLVADGRVRTTLGICAPGGAVVTASPGDSRPVKSLMSRGKRDELCDAPKHVRGGWSSAYVAGMCSSVADLCQHYQCPPSSPIMTSSLYGDGPPLLTASSSSLLGDPDDLTLAFYSTAVSHISSLLLSCPPLATARTAPSPSSPLTSVVLTQTHSQLLIALSNVLCIALRHLSLPITPCLPPSPSSQLPDATPSSRSAASHVLPPASAAPAAADAAVGISSGAAATSHQPTTSRAQSSAPPATSPSLSSQLAVRVLTPIIQCPIQPVTAATGRSTRGRLQNSSRRGHLTSSGSRSASAAAARHRPPCPASPSPPASLQPQPLSPVIAAPDRASSLAAAAHSAAAHPAPSASSCLTSPLPWPPVSPSHSESENEQAVSLPSSSPAPCSSSPELLHSIRPDDSQATSHFCDASSSPASAEEPGPAAASPAQSAAAEPASSLPLFPPHSPSRPPSPPASPPRPSLRITTSNPFFVLALAAEPESPATAPDASTRSTPCLASPSLPVSASAKPESESVVPSSPALPGSPASPQSSSPDDSQATSHSCDASSSPAPSEEPVADSASQEQSGATESAADVAAIPDAAASARQLLARQCPQPSPTSPSRTSCHSLTAPACTATVTVASLAAVRSSARSAACSDHPFFRWLLRPPASDASAQHCRRHYLQSSPMCGCTLFPVYSSEVDLQLPSNPSGRRFVNCLSNLCLHCITLVWGLPLPLNSTARAPCGASGRPTTTSGTSWALTGASSKR